MVRLDSDKAAVQSRSIFMGWMDRDGQEARTVRYTGNCEQTFPKSAISELNNHGIL